jgi:hypothetical protein
MQAQKLGMPFADGENWPHNRQPMAMDEFSSLRRFCDVRFWALRLAWAMTFRRAALCIKPLPE